MSILVSMSATKSFEGHTPSAVIQLALGSSDLTLFLGRTCSCLNRLSVLIVIEIRKLQKPVTHDRHL